MNHSQIKYGEMVAVGFLFCLFAISVKELLWYVFIPLSFIIGAYVYWRIVVLISRTKERIKRKTLYDIPPIIWSSERLPEALVFGDYSTDEKFLKLMFQEYGKQQIEKYKRISNSKSLIEKHQISLDLSEDFNAHNVSISPKTKKLTKTDGCGNK